MTRNEFFRSNHHPLDYDSDYDYDPETYRGVSQLDPNSKWVTAEHPDRPIRLHGMNLAQLIYLSGSMIADAVERGEIIRWTEKKRFFSACLDEHNRFFPYGGC